MRNRAGCYLDKTEKGCPVIAVLYGEPFSMPLVGVCRAIRAKHRLNSEHVTGLTQQAVVRDVAAKIVCDNLQVLVALTTNAEAGLFDGKRANHAYVRASLTPLTPILLLGDKFGKRVSKLLRNVIAGKIYSHR